MTHLLFLYSWKTCIDQISADNSKDQISADNIRESIYLLVGLLQVSTQIICTQIQKLFHTSFHTNKSLTCPRFYFYLKM